MNTCILFLQFPGVLFMITKFHGCNTYVCVGVCEWECRAWAVHPSNSREPHTAATLWKFALVLWRHHFPTFLHLRGKYPRVTSFPDEKKTKKTVLSFGFNSAPHVTPVPRESPREGACSPLRGTETDFMAERKFTSPLRPAPGELSPAPRTWISDTCHYLVEGRRRYTGKDEGEKGRRRDTEREGEGDGYIEVDGGKRTYQDT